MALMPESFTRRVCWRPAFLRQYQIRLQVANHSRPVATSLLASSPEKVVCDDAHRLGFWDRHRIQGPLCGPNMKFREEFGVCPQNYWGQTLNYDSARMLDVEESALETRAGAR